MINLSASGGSVTFAFSGNSGYLQDGTIVVPVNSLSLIIDESDMVTFRKPNNDVFVSALLSEFGMTKDEMIAWYKANMVGSTGGGGGITSGEVQTMIDESISGKADTSAVTASLADKVNVVDNQVEAYDVVSSSAMSFDSEFSADTYANAAFYRGSSDAEEFGMNKVEGRIVIIDENDNVVEDYTVPSNQQTTTWNPNSQYFTVVMKGTDNVAIEPNAGYRIKYTNLYVQGISIYSTNYYESSAKYPSYQSAEAIENNIYPKLDELESGKTDVSAFTAHTSDTIIHVTSAQTASWDAKSDFSGSYNDLTDKPTIPTVPTSNTAFTNDAGYITVDALSGYAESSAVTDEITAAVSGKQDTLSAGTGIDITDNVISATGGGTTYSAGTNISIANDTIKCTLPLTVGSSNTSLSLGTDNNLGNSNRVFAIGDSNTIYNSSANSLAGGMRSTINYNCASSIAFGYQANVGGRYSCSIGSNTKTSNDYEAAFGIYNVSNTGSTSADKTRFSVGNGTADNARHNVFEIRQNGDIYLSSGGTDIKLQDYLGGGSITVDTALDSGSTNPVENRVIYNKFDEVEQVTAAGLNAVNDKFGGLKLVKLTQAQYDALSGNTDANTLYVIVNPPSWHIIPSGSTISTLKGSKIRVSSSVLANESDNVAFGTTSDNVYALSYIPSMGGWFNWQTWTSGSSTPFAVNQITQVDGYYEIDFGEELNGFGSYTDSSATTTTDVAPFEFEIYY